MSIEAKIDELVKARKERRKKWAEVLGSLHEALEDAFEERHLVGPCHQCQGCLDEYEEKAVQVGRLIFSDGGNCYKPVVALAREGLPPLRVAFRHGGEWRMMSSIRIPWSELRSALQEVEGGIEALIESAKKLTPTTE